MTAPRQIVSQSIFTLAGPGPSTDDKALLLYLALLTLKENPGHQRGLVEHGLGMPLAAG